MRVVPLVAITIALISGALAWEQRQAAAALQIKVASLNDEVVKKDDASREQATLLERLQEENEVYKAEYASLRDKVSKTRNPTTASQDREDNASSTSQEKASADLFSKMVKDPKLNEVARQWHLARIKKVYRDFVRARRLNPQQTKQFFDLLLKKETRSREEAAQMLSGEEDGPGSDKAASASQKTEIEQQLKLLLGKNDYAEFEDYKESTGPRETMLDIQEQFARTGTTLSADQAKTLLEMMLEAHGLDGNVVDRLETVLSPEQYEELLRFQRARDEMRNLRFEAATEMMKRNEKTNPPVPTPSP